MSVGADGTVLAVNPTGGVIYQYNGNNTWNQMIGNSGCPPEYPHVPFTQVAVGSSAFIRALDAQANLYTYYASYPVWTCEGSFGSGAKYIAAASDYTFVFIDSTGTTQLVPYDPTPPAR